MISVILGTQGTVSEIGNIGYIGYSQCYWIIVTDRDDTGYTGYNQFYQLGTFSSCGDTRLRSSRQVYSVQSVADPHTTLL